jgi:hypothetical protein
MIIKKQILPSKITPKGVTVTGVVKNPDNGSYGSSCPDARSPRRRNALSFQSKKRLRTFQNKNLKT